MNKEANTKLRIVNLQPADKEAIQQAAAVLVAGFPPAVWPDLASGLAEVHEILADEQNVILVAMNEEGQVLGWVGALNEYKGHTWQLHPLVVHPEYQGRGVGRTLVSELEGLAQARGVTTIYLGTDDEYNQTSLSGVELYPQVVGHIATIKNINRHPFEFYQKMGFIIVGLVPDANGPGKPDIMMAKRVGR